MRRAAGAARRAPWAAALGVLVGCVGCGADARSGAGASPARNVLLISVDTLRADHVSLYGYARATTPRIDAFFADAQVWTRAYSPEASTSPAVASLLSGLYPARHGVRLHYQKLDPGVPLLSDRLGAAGWQTAAVVSNNVLTVEAMDLGRHFEHYDDFVDEREARRDYYERRAERTTDAALAWLAGGRDPARPHLLWTHYIDPHGPYAAPTDRPVRFEHEGERPIDLARVRRYMLLEGTADGLDYVDRYDEEIAYVDQEVGRLLDAYGALGLLDETVVVFTADHGETMLEHEELFSHGYHVWEPIVRVPLLVRAPGLAGGRRDELVSLVDVVPTLLGLVGLEPSDGPGGLDGLPLGTRDPAGSISVEATSRDRQRRARIQGTRKWFVEVDSEGRVTSRGWLELDGSVESPERLRAGDDAGFAELLEWVARDPDPGGIPRAMERGSELEGPKVAPGRSAEELEALRRLGYVE